MRVPTTAGASNLGGTLVGSSMDANILVMLLATRYLLVWVLVRTVIDGVPLTDSI
jgi:hypothetical protein